MSEEMIKVPSSRFGDLEVRSGSVITILSGIIGFPDFNRYILLEYNEPFSWLQSVENPDLAFVVVNGAEFGPNYKFPIPFDDPDLDLKESDDIAIVNLVSVRPNPSETTVNLKAPVIVNLRTMMGRQLVLDDPNLPTRFPLWSKDEGENAETSEEKPSK